MTGKGKQKINWIQKVMSKSFGQTRLKRKHATTEIKVKRDHSHYGGARPVVNCRRVFRLLGKVLRIPAGNVSKIILKLDSDGYHFSLSLHSTCRTNTWLIEMTNLKGGTARFNAMTTLAFNCFAMINKSSSIRAIVRLSFNVVCFCWTCANIVDSINNKKIKVPNTDVKWIPAEFQHKLKMCRRSIIPCRTECRVEKAFCSVFDRLMCRLG